MNILSPAWFHLRDRGMHSWLQLDGGEGYQIKFSKTHEHNSHNTGTTVWFHNREGCWNVNFSFHGELEPISSSHGINLTLLSSQLMRESCPPLPMSIIDAQLPICCSRIMTFLKGTIRVHFTNFMTLMPKFSDSITIFPTSSRQFNYLGYHAMNDHKLIGIHSQSDANWMKDFIGSPLKFSL